MISVPLINWQPIEVMPNDRKDGRRMLLWAGDVDLAEIAEWEAGIWITPGGATVRDIRFWADINPPE